MYRDPKVKLRKDKGMRDGLRFAAAALLLLAVVQSLAILLFF